MEYFPGACLSRVSGVVPLFDPPIKTVAPLGSERTMSVPAVTRFFSVTEWVVDECSGTVTVLTESSYPVLEILTVYFPEGRTRSLLVLPFWIPSI
jgi:hypothetical protein